MAKWNPPHMLFRWNFLPIFLGLAMITLGVAIGGWYTLGPSWNLNSFDIWFIFGFCILMAGVGISGFDAILKEGTPPAVTPIGMFPLADITELQVTTHAFVPPPNSSGGRLTAIAGQNYDPKKVGLDRLGRQVPLGVMPLGGRKAFGLHLGAGRAGYLILHGPADYIRMSDRRRSSEFFFTPKVLISLDHTEVEPEVIDTLIEHDKFVKGRSPFYALGPICEPFRAFVRQNRVEVLKILGEPPQPGEIEVGQADQTYFHGRYLSVLAENQYHRYNTRAYLDTIRSLSDIIHGRAIRQATESRRPRVPGTEPVYGRQIQHPSEEEL